MPSVSERLRRPMDESMLLRLVMVSGLMRGSDLARFYSEGGGGLDGSRTLEDFLLASGITVEQLNVVKRAYVETSDFGSTLLEGMRMRRADEQSVREMRKALNVCETQQLLAIKRGEAPAPIGEMLVAQGRLSRQELDRIIHQQGMLTRIERYSSEARDRAAVSWRDRLRALVAGKGTAFAAGALLVVVILANLWLAGAFRSTPDLFASARNSGEHARNVRAYYGNMLSELRRGQTANAEYYRGLLKDYLERLAAAKIALADEEADRIAGVYSSLDFAAIEKLPPPQRMALPQADLEKRLAVKP